MVDPLLLATSPSFPHGTALAHARRTEMKTRREKRLPCVHNIQMNFYLHLQVVMPSRKKKMVLLHR